MGYSTGTEALLPRGMRDLSGPGIEPVSPALADGFLTTGPPGKSLGCGFLLFFFFFLAVLGLCIMWVSLVALWHVGS